MLDPLRQIFNDSDSKVRNNLFGIYGVLIGINVFASVWAFVAFHAYPVLLGTAMLAYGFGLRHAVDADHIAAIDNVTRKLMQERKRPVAVGFFFSLGHSSVVVLASVAVALATEAIQGRFDSFKAIGGMIGTFVSAVFLFALALMNFLICAASIVRGSMSALAGRTLMTTSMCCSPTGGSLPASSARFFAW